jgi:V8-like Glu-specific endopeptidase
MRRWIAAVAMTLALVVLSAGSSLGATGDRTQIGGNKLTQRPFRGTVLVSVGNTVVCTGFIVAPRKVVTAAHCLTRDASKGDYRFRKGLPGNIRLYRGYSAAAGGQIYPDCGVARAWAPARFIRADARDRVFGSRKHDFAVLTTPASCSYPSNAILRMWPTTLPGRQLKTGNAVKLAGYPSDRRYEGMNGLNLWRTSGKLLSSQGEPKLLRLTGLVAQGMSGGPVWRNFNKKSPCGLKQCVVGVLTECAVNDNGLCKKGDSVRRAIRITPAVRKALRNH